MKKCKRCHEMFENKTEGEKMCEPCWKSGHRHDKTEYRIGYNKETKEWD